MTNLQPTTSEHVENQLISLSQGADSFQKLINRFQAEVRFCVALASHRTDTTADWMRMISMALDHVSSAMSAQGDIDQAIEQAEQMLAPLGEAAKQYTIHCVGHGHIDMNWMWNWPETVAVTNDTFTTVDRLMDEYPDFHYSQSQTSVYQIVKDYNPALYERIRQRIEEGRWEVTANQWVEGDKNLASGEILCRQILYTKRFLKREFNLPYDKVTIDWEPDTFGHAHTLPTILNKAGIKRYYLHRAGPGPMLFWWQGKDGSRVLTFDDRLRGYNGQINEAIVQHLLDFEAATALKDFLFVFGVGDHGGGPTRRDLNAAMDMQNWPLYPVIKFSTTDAFFSIAEQNANNLPVVDNELNFVFEGCYTAQSSIKRANRTSENALVCAEVYALMARGLVGLPFPGDDLFLAWRPAMFNQFHDILPGSGIHATYEYAQGLFQEVLARTSMVKTRSLRMIAGQINTVLAGQSAPYKLTNDIGGGPGDIPSEGSLSRRGAGGVNSDPFVIFNPSAWKRSEVVTARLWDRTYPDATIQVVDETGNRVKAQVLDRGNYWGHQYINVAFPATDVPGMGYRTYHVARDVKQSDIGIVRASCDGKHVLENHWLKVVVEQSSGAIIHLVDKRTGLDLVPAGQRIALLEYLLEAPHPMTAWVMGQIKEKLPFTHGAVIDFPQTGPHMVSVRSRYQLHDSLFTMTISLAANNPRLDFTLEVNWLERGSADKGVPMLRVGFPLAITNCAATFECPNGHVARTTKPDELASYTSWLGGTYWPRSEAVDTTPGDVPAQKWASLQGMHARTGEVIGATILNDSKYGYNVEDNTIRLTLLRSSYDPDPLPELGAHTIRFALQLHDNDWTASDATRAGYEFNMPFEVVSTDEHTGDLPSWNGTAEIVDSNVMISGMKKAEDSDALVIRLYEMNGQPTEARVRLDACLCEPNAVAVEVDLIEQPTLVNSARMEKGMLSVLLPAYGLVTVKIG